MKPYRKVSFGPVDISKTILSDQSILLESNISLDDHPTRTTERLVTWADQTPDKIFLGEKEEDRWQTLTYADAHTKVRAMGQFLLDSQVSTNKPLAILSENSIEHGLMALGAMHVGLPYSPIAPAYSLKSKDHIKLNHVVDLLTPGAVFVSDGLRYENALKDIYQHEPLIIVGKNPCLSLPCIHIDELLETTATHAVEEAFERIEASTIAKILFTSGSTGMPKGVINTHGNITTNWQQITQTFPFIKDEFRIIDWLPWNHTFGGNHNFGLTLYNGGSMYIDNGNPTPKGIKLTIDNLHEIIPTVYFNVPKGFGELVNYLREDEPFRQKFFSEVKMLFYAGAGMPQHTWDALENLALDTIGERVLIVTGLGCTESSPSALFSTRADGQPGRLGVPVPGLKLKLVPSEDKFEARYKGPNIFPGYWRNEKVTKQSFDEDGYYKTGDALRFFNEKNPEEGMLFDGRIVEDFKLDTGTWIHVGNIRSKLLLAGHGLIHDAVITGHDLPYVGAIVFLDLEIGKRMFELDENARISDLDSLPELKDHLQQLLNDLASVSTGSSTLIKKILIADFDLSSDAGELTDKGSVNQRKVIETRSEKVQLIYSNDPSPFILTAQ